MQEFQPKYAQIWKYFNEICSTPRPSGKEEKIREYIINKFEIFILFSILLLQIINI